MKIQNKIHINNQAFTLVELILVITILAILGTIAFISLQGFSAQARDSKRVSDISNIKKSLELFSLNSGKYPEPDDYFTVSYGSQDLRYQGTVGDQVTTNLSRNLNEKPTDPLTESEYIYSRTYGGTEYEVLSIYESDLISLTSPLLRGTEGDIFYQTNAANVNYPKISGNYNGVYIKANSYYIPTPSITNGNIWGNIDLEIDITALESQIVTGGNNVPGVSTGGLVGLTLEVFTGSLDTDIGEDDGNKVQLAQALINAYSGSVLENVGVYQEIVETSSEDFISLVDIFVLNKDNFTNTISSNYGLGDTTFWRDLDPNCLINDIYIPEGCEEGTEGCQIWAGCNSTLGDYGFERGKKDNGTNGSIGYCYNYDGDQSPTYTECAIGNINMASNASAKDYFDSQQPDGTNQAGNVEYDTIWGKLYTWDGAMNGACPSGWRLPSDEDFFNLELALGATDISTNGDYSGILDISSYSSGVWTSYGLGWKKYGIETTLTNLTNALKIPLSGWRRFSDSSTFSLRGQSTLLWTSTPYGDKAYNRAFIYSYSTVNRDTDDKNSGVSVRCVKD